jgi:hypothetical protein
MDTNSVSEIKTAIDNGETMLVVAAPLPDDMRGAIQNRVNTAMSRVTEIRDRIAAIAASEDIASPCR